MPSIITRSLLATLAVAGAIAFQPPVAVPSGIVSSCTKFAMAKEGDDCDTFAKANGITNQDVKSWNPNLGAECYTLEKDGWYCVAAGAPSGGSKQAGRRDSSKQHQVGMVEGCKELVTAKKGDTCFKYTETYKISLADFIKWNPGVGPECKDFWAGYEYCVSASGSGPGPSATPQPSTPQKANTAAPASPANTERLQKPPTGEGTLAAIGPTLTTSGEEKKPEKTDK
ncbi:hypothetical protein AJ80_09420 [Polytolypa hystricis UAMH7299]|uniref:LysM domain-containing protein n=1 Tax=Polytolypa hystricis (strain UAMH7299) TaxID=1447883 RepID=A0A2B7WRB0_POLH7|nr:hypothetical protein AJ80_09420 [Polytolypa hystricis UAMH7299]